MYGYRLDIDSDMNNTLQCVQMVQDDVDFSWYARDEVESTMSDYDYELRAVHEELRAKDEEIAALRKYIIGK